MFSVSAQRCVGVVESLRAGADKGSIRASGGDHLSVGPEGVLALLDGSPVVLPVPSVLRPGVHLAHVGTSRAPWPDEQPQQPQARGVQHKKAVQICAATEHASTSQAVPTSMGHRGPSSICWAGTGRTDPTRAQLCRAPYLCAAAARVEMRLLHTWARRVRAASAITDEPIMGMAAPGRMTVRGAVHSDTVGDTDVLADISAVIGAMTNRICRVRQYLIAARTTSGLQLRSATNTRR